MSINAHDHTAFIRKLTEITEANLANEHFGVKELANEMGISHSQLHRKLHAISNKSTSQFIREVRLKKAKEMLKRELCTASEVAYKVGFSSPSYFNKCFHDYFGYTPGEYKKHTDEFTYETTSNTPTEQKTQPATSNVNLGNKKLLFIAGGVLVIILFSFFSYRFLNGELTKNTVKSIAILPLTNSSDDPKNQSLADGIMNDITNRLSHIHEFEVKSTVSTKAYKSPDISIYEIAKELGVSYIVEGCLYKTEDGVRLYVRLIHTKHDKTIWSEKYDDDLSNALYFVSNVSKQIADELEAVLTPEESELLNKKYTLNKEAYNLYAEGRFYWQLRGEENLRKSIEYYNQALELDSNYCLPYVGLADSYAILSWFQFDPWQMNIPKTRKYIEKALAIDKNLAEAHATLGLIASLFDWNWDLAEKEFQKAIELNPNYATAHQWYSEYLSIIGEKEKARKHIEKAIDLKPHTRILLQVSYNTHFRLGNYNNALEVTEKIFRIDGDIKGQANKKFNIFLRQKNELEALEEYKKLLFAYSPKNDAQLFDSIYSESGIEGIIRFKIGRQLKNEIKNCYFLAQNYALISKNDKALDYLTMAYENRVPNVVQIKYELDFKSLRDELCFLALLEKMNLGGY